MFWKRKRLVTPDDLASALMADCLSKPCVEPARSDMALQERERFDEQATYQIATVLFGLGMEGKKRPEFLKIPAIIITKLQSVDGGEEAVAEVKNASYKLGELFTSTAKQFSWARTWYADIGIDESNPAVLGDLATNWLAYLGTTLRVLRGFAIK